MTKLKLKPGLDGVRLREAPVNGKAVGQIYKDDLVESLESLEDTRRKLSAQNEWLQVKVKGLTAYTAAWLLDPAEPLPEPEKPKLAVRPSKNGLRIRAAPINGTQVAQVNIDAVLISLEDDAATQAKLSVQDQWLKVRTLYDQEGYAAAWLLELHTGEIPKPAPVPAAPNITGMNLDPRHPLGSPDPARLQGLGWVRIGYSVSMEKGSEDIDYAYNYYRPHIEKYARAGLKVILVFTHQTYGEGKNEFWPWHTMTTEKWRRLTAKFAAMVERIVAQYAGKNLVHAYQVWNEMDAPIGAEASVPMSPQNYAIVLGETIQAIKRADPTALVLSGGHTAGPVNGGNYARATLAALPAGVRPDGLAFHPYGRGITQPKEPYAIFGHIDDEMRAYLPLLPGKPIWITEWGVLNRENDPNRNVLEYASGLVRYMKQRYAGQVAAMIWYAWAMSMHNGYGLVDRSDSPLQPMNDEFRKL